MTTTTEEIVRQEQADYDAEQENDKTLPDPEGDALFDRSQYETEELALPKIDGETVDKIRVAFTGSVMLDRADPADCDLIRRLALGRDVTLRIEGKPATLKYGYTTNKNGDLDALVLERKVKVETVYRPAAEEL
jgi:hypothetical protein